MGPRTPYVAPAGSDDAFTALRAVRDAHAVKGPARAVLYALAMRGNGYDGTEAFPSAARIASESGLGVSTVTKHLELLQAEGYIRRGDQSLAPASRHGGKPVVVYDLDLEALARANTSQVEIGVTVHPHEVHAVTATEARPDANLHFVEPNHHEVEPNTYEVGMNNPGTTQEEPLVPDSLRSSGGRFAELDDALLAATTVLDERGATLEDVIDGIEAAGIADGLTYYCGGLERAVGDTHNPDERDRRTYGFAIQMWRRFVDEAVA